MSTFAIPTDVLVDLMQCVQAARDGAPKQSLFAMQCDVVLANVSQALPDAIVPQPLRMLLGNPDLLTRRPI
jgi:hypothetical protein